MGVGFEFQKWDTTSRIASGGHAVHKVGTRKKTVESINRTEENNIPVTRKCHGSRVQAKLRFRVRGSNAEPA